MIYRNWSLLTSPTTILAGIIGTFVVSNLLFIKNISFHYKCQCVHMCGYEQEEIQIKEFRK
ncbi:hypothetical protein PHJA_001200000 [Phtheirospermum japonicum]|uniref:Uncharacterized protein n=1 Tax=Phtheirospermum japonicum TaxID=374723 RepID=A0A830BSY1_9LAMI|nr:hypothetical protein PHJA_001200000 [Phtheirospermum japonicum]